MGLTLIYSAPSSRTPKRRMLRCDGMSPRSPKKSSPSPEALLQQLRREQPSAAAIVDDLIVRFLRSQT